MRKKLKRISRALILPAVMSMTLAGCAGAFGGSSEGEGETTSYGDKTDFKSETNEVQSGGNTESTESTDSKDSTDNTKTDDTNESTQSYSGNIPEGFSERDFRTSYENPVKVTLANSATVAESDGVTIEGDKITFTKDGTYLLSGDLSNGQIAVDLPGENDKIQLVLDGVNISNESSAAIYVKNADKVFITTTSGSQNKIATTGTFVQSDENNIDGAIFSKDDIVFNGEGDLIISSTDHGIVSKNDLKITSGNYEISSTSKALQGKDFVGIAGGDINIDAGTDGIESVRVAIYDGDLSITAGDDGINVMENEEDNNPEIIIAGGNTYIESGDDAIQTSGDINVSGGDINIVSGGGSENAAEHYDDMMFGQMGGWQGMGQGGPKFGGDPDGRGEINYDTDDDETSGDGSKMKGIKAANVTLTDGNINIDAQDDAINADGEVRITGGSYTFIAGDDGVHADEIITIDGGKISVDTWEGFEATQVAVNDGYVTIIANDDGINAGQKVSSLTPSITITGGDINIEMGPGDTDALDSNGDIYILGGNVNLNCQSPFDYDGDGEISGGTVYVNGEQISEMYNQFMGGMQGGPGGQGFDGGHGGPGGMRRGGDEI